MNATGIVFAVALPAFALGVSAATWASGKIWSWYCADCGASHTSTATCGDCVRQLVSTHQPAQNEAQRVADVHLMP